MKKGLFRTGEQDTILRNLMQCFIFYLPLNLINIYISIIFVTDFIHKFEDVDLFYKMTSALIRFNMSFGYVILILVEIIIVYYFIRGWKILKIQAKHTGTNNKVLNLIMLVLFTLLMGFSSFYFYIYSVASVLFEEFN